MDFERQIDESAEMKQSLEQLKSRHAELKKDNQTQSKKIEAAKKQIDCIVTMPSYWESVLFLYINILFL